LESGGPVPSLPPRDTHRPLDLSGAALLGVGVLGLLFPGAAAGGAGRQGDYGRAYASSLTVSVVFAVAALVLAVRDVHRTREPQQA
jgi:hypothetical protein